MRVVLDTNVVVSGLIWGGKPYQLLQAATDGDITLYTSPVLLDELREVLAREHLASRLAKKASPSSVELAVGSYGELAVVVSPLATPKASRDPDDDEVLACALAAQADLIVSGDGDLLTLGSFQGIAIVTVTAAQATARIEQAVCAASEIPIAIHRASPANARYDYSHGDQGLARRRAAA